MHCNINPTINQKMMDNSLTNGDIRVNHLRIITFWTLQYPGGIRFRTVIFLIILILSQNILPGSDKTRFSSGASFVVLNKRKLNGYIKP